MSYESTKIFSIYKEFYELFLTQMKEKPKDPVSQRFIEAIDSLIEKGVVKSYYKLAKDLNLTNQQKFTDIKSGKQYVRTDFLNTVCKFLNIDSFYILTGKTDNKECPGEVIIKGLQEENDMLKEVIDQQSKLIADLQKENIKINIEKKRIEEKLNKS